MTTEKPDPTALLPCPFCGVQMNVGLHTAGHPENGCVMAEKDRNEISDFEYAAWNTRALQPQGPTTADDAAVLWQHERIVRMLKDAHDNPNMSYDKNGLAQEYEQTRAAVLSRMSGQGWHKLSDEHPGPHREVWLSDGTFIRVGFWVPTEERWVDFHRADNGQPNRSLPFAPTHWVPLPTAPEAQR
jgi:sarcosine oxidase delta subunit